MPRFYSMDCLALFKLSDKSQFWSNLKNTLMINCCSGIELFGSVTNRLADCSHHSYHANYLLDVRCDLLTRKGFMFNVRQHIFSKYIP